MDCAEARPLIDPYLDGELGVERSMAFERHLEGCDACSGALAGRKALAAALRGKLAYEPAPLSLQRAVRAGIKRAEGAGHARRAPQPWLRLAASFLLVAGLSSALTWYVAPRNADLVPDEVFASHVRGMLSERGGIDVASSDEHTVRPWFATKLDFAPAVKDLGTEGFPLLGGRVDYVAGRTVAALLYQHRKHVITLFVWPSGERALALETSVRQGDNLAHWSDGAMSYWAVSDLAAPELADFCARYRVAELASPAPAAGTKQP